MTKFMKIAVSLLLLAALTAAPATALSAEASDPESLFTFNDEFSGICFPSIANLKAYLSAVSSREKVDYLNNDEWAFYQCLNTLYFPTGFTEKTDKISEILITSSYLCVTFDCEGVFYRLYYYYSAISGKSALNSAKSCLEIGFGLPMYQAVDGHGVYSTFSYRQARNSWEQDGNYFTLEVAEKNADPNVRYFELCTAEAYPLADPPPETGFRTLNGKVYYKNADGSSPKGWTKIGGKTYYFLDTGEAMSKNTVVGGIRYRFSPEGVLLGRYSGWVKRTTRQLKSTYYYYKNGVPQSGWLKLGEKTYYLNEDGSRVTGTLELDGVIYDFGYDGVLAGQYAIE